MPKAHKTAVALQEPTERIAAPTLAEEAPREAHPPQKRPALLVLSIVLVSLWMAFLAWMAFRT